MITTMSSDLLTELMDTLVDARGTLDLALSRIPDNDRALKETIETAIGEIDSVRLKALKLVLDEDPS